MYLSSVCRKFAAIQACYKSKQPEQASNAFLASQVTNQSTLPPHWLQAV